MGLNQLEDIDGVCMESLRRLNTDLRQLTYWKYEMLSLEVILRYKLEKQSIKSINEH